MNIRKQMDLDEKELRQVKIYSKLLDILFSSVRVTVNVKSINYPQNDDKIVFAMWHSDQLAVYGIPKEKRSKTNILISQSFDGEIVAQLAESWGYKTVRGSENKNAKTGTPMNKGGTKAAFDMIDLLNEGENIAIMVDGPRGPLHKVKNGIINVLKHTNATVVPLVWYSPDITFLKMPSWDKMVTPIWFTRIAIIFGEPIQMKENATKEEQAEFKELLRRKLLDLQEKAPEEWKKAFKK